MRFLRDNGLSVFFGVVFLGALAGQAISGHQEYNQEEVSHAELLDDRPHTVSLGRYLTSSSFGQAVTENWQSEYLQFALYILATVWLLQRGSPESKELHKPGRESDAEQRLGRHARPDSPRWARVGGLGRLLFSNSLLIVMAAIFLGSWFAHSVTGWSEYNADQSPA